MNPRDMNDNPSGPMMRLAGVDEDHCDALADLFLGEGELAPETRSSTGTDSVDAAPVTRPAPVVVVPKLEPVVRVESDDADADEGIGSLPTLEVVLLGHLPVRASLWVRQYACSVAKRRHERVALVRVLAGSVSIDMINAPRSSEPEAPSLHSAMSRVLRDADRIIVRVDETSEPDLIERDEIDEVTILTGADEAAIVSSYRLVKGATSSWERDELIGTPHLRLAVMGASGEQAQQASVKLTRAIDAFLDRPIEIIDAAGRIDSTETTSVYRGNDHKDATSIIDELVEIGCGLTEAIEDEAAGETAGPADHDPDTQIEHGQIVTHRVSLCSVLEGFERLETRCPYAPLVEFGADRHGRLHVLCDDSCENPVAQLASARAWSRDHLEMIIRAEDALSFPSSSRNDDSCVAHLLARNPKNLRGVIDSDIHLYALADVTMGDVLVSVATPIN